MRVVLFLIGIFLSPILLPAESEPGEVVGWGANATGEATGIRSTGSMSSQSTGCSTGSVMVAGQYLSDIVAIAAGTAHSLALKKDGTVAFWGAQQREAVGKANSLVTIGGTVLSNVAAVAAGRTHGAALKSDGSVVAWLDWGNNNFEQASVPPGLHDVTAIAAGGNHTIALKKDGTIVGWGEGNEPPAGLSNVVAISAGRMWDTASDLALTSSGEVVEWRLRGVQLRVPVPAELTNVVAISAGLNHNLALINNGTVFGWGDNSLGQATGVATVSSSHSASGLVSLNGRALSNVVAIAAGNECSFALKGDGTIVGWGRMSNGRSPAGPPGGLTNVSSIAVGEGFCLAITTNAAVATEFLRKGVTQ